MAAVPLRCYLGTAPALGKLSAVVGENFATSWLTLQIAYFSQSLKTADQLTEADIQTLAMLILSNYPQLNLAEIMLFFSRLAGGVYGQVAFGQVRAENITTKIPLFLKHRTLELDRYERAQQQLQREAEAHHRATYSVTRTEYERIKAEALEMCNGDEKAAEQYIKQQYAQPQNTNRQWHNISSSNNDYAAPTCKHTSKRGNATK